MARDLTAPVYEYRIQCHPAYKWHMDVLIFRSQKALYAYRDFLGMRHRPCLACFAPGHNTEFVKGRQARGNYIGEMAFTVPKFRAGIVAHECAHAGLAFMRKIRKDVGHNDEETFAWAVGELARLTVLGYQTAKKARRKKQ